MSSARSPLLAEYLVPLAPEKPCAETAAPELFVPVEVRGASAGVAAGYLPGTSAAPALPLRRQHAGRAPCMSFAGLLLQVLPVNTGQAKAGMRRD